MSVNNNNSSGGISADTGQEDISSIKPEEVIFISKQPQPQRATANNESNVVYEVFSLREHTTTTTNSNGEQGPPSTSFQLSRTQLTNVPQPLLDEFEVGVAAIVPEHLQNGPTRRVHVVASTASGTGLAADFYDAVLRPLLESRGITPAAASDGDEAKPGIYRLVKTHGADSIRDFARDLSRDGGDKVRHTVVLLSGDGGIVELLNGITPTSTVANSDALPLLAILPLGTGNALFNSLHKSVVPTVPTATATASALGGLPTAGTAALPPSTLVQSLRTLFRGVAAPLPSFRAEFSEGARMITYNENDDDAEAVAVKTLYGAVVASYGFHSQLVWESDTPAYRKHGAKRFGMVAQELLKTSHAYRAVVEVSPPSPSHSPSLPSSSSPPSLSSSQTLPRTHHAYILATMLSNLEKTFTISPASKPLDGKLRLVHFGAVDGETTMRVMIAAYDGGRHVGMRWGKKGEEGEKEEGVGYEEAEVVKVTTREEDARWRKVCVDGAIVELPRDGTMTVAKEKEARLLVLVDRSVLGG